MKKRYFIFISLLIFCMFLTACKESIIKEIKINNFQAEMKINDEYILDLEIIKENINEYDIKVYASNDKLEINDLKIKAVKSGEVTLTIKVSGGKNTKTIELSKDFSINIIEEKEELKVTDIIINNELTDLFVGDSINLDISVLPDLITDEVFISSDLDYVSIDNKKITFNKAGEVDIMFKCQDYEKKVKVTVKEKYINLTDASLIVDKKEYFVGEEISYQLDFIPSDANIIEYKVIVSENLQLKDNSIIAIKAGKAVITLVVKDNEKEIKKEVEIVIFEKENNEEIAKKILDWAVESVGTSGIDEIFLPKTHPDYGGSISFISEDSDLVDIESGFLGFPDFDEVCKLTCKVIYKDISINKEFPFIVEGYEAQNLCKMFLKPIKAYITNDVEFKTHFDDFSGTDVTWSSSNEEILDNKGRFTRPINDTMITITYTIKTTEPVFIKTYTKEFLAKGMSVKDKAELIQSWIYETVGSNGVIYPDTILPTECPMYDASLEWTNEDGSEIVFEDIISNPITSSGMYLRIKVSIGTDFSIIKMYYKIQSMKYNSKWEAVEAFLNLIAKEKIETHQYQTFGSTTINVTNYGYLPFYLNEKSNLTEAILPYTYGYIRTGIVKTSTEYIVVHDTGNNSQGSNALAHKNYLNNLNSDPDNSTYISWHFTTDEDGVVQHLPLEEVAYHAGDGSTTYPNTWDGGLGGGNRNGIGIESCVNAGSDYNKTMRNTAKLVAELLLKFNLGFDRIKQHNDFSGKDCPMTMRHANRWNEFIYLVQLEYFGKTELNDVSFVWKSLTPEVMDDTGKVINHTGEGTIVKYQCTVTYNKEVKVYNFESKLMKV